MTRTIAAILGLLLGVGCAASPPVVLHSREANVHGTMLRYEPQPHKNTLGYWVNAEDYATWEVAVPRGGTYEVQVLQGCGPGQGGSEVAVSIDGQSLAFIVQDTGHFQNFVPRVIGRVKLDAGSHTLTVKPVTKAHHAVMDLRQVTLRRVGG